MDAEVFLTIRPSLEKKLEPLKIKIRCAQLYGIEIDHRNVIEKMQQKARITCTEFRI